MIVEAVVVSAIIILALSPLPLSNFNELKGVIDTILFFWLVSSAYIYIKSLSTQSVIADPTFPSAKYPAKSPDVAVQRYLR